MTEELSVVVFLGLIERPQRFFAEPEISTNRRDLPGFGRQDRNYAREHHGALNPHDFRTLLCSFRAAGNRYGRAPSGSGSKNDFKPMVMDVGCWRSAQTRGGAYGHDPKSDIRHPKSVFEWHTVKGGSRLFVL